jgi:hypothetical protein
MPPIFFLNWPLALQMGLARQPICSEKSRLWYTKSFKWIIIEIPRNIVCLIVFYLKYAIFFLHFKPPHLINQKEFLDRPTATRTGKGKLKDDPNLLSSTGAWSCELVVHRVVWNNGNGLASWSLMAAGTASCLCRVDVLWGRWFKDKPPYGGAEGIQMEDEDVMDVEFEGDSE